jgi:CheY-like chemotaxis protein
VGQIFVPTAKRPGAPAVAVRAFSIGSKGSVATDPTVPLIRVNKGHARIAFGQVICDFVLGIGQGTDLHMTPAKPPGGSVFLVEDEAMIRMMVADMLEELGYSIAAETGEIEQALKLARTTNFDIAILDVNVNGKLISPVAEVIEARNRPFIFATGYGTQGLPPEYRDRPALQKPFQMENLAIMIERTLKGSAAA